MATQTNDLRTAAGCHAAYKAKGKLLERVDFPAGPEGWQMWCDHKIRKETLNVARAQNNIVFWTKVKAGEHMAAAESKVAELQAALLEIQQLKAELAKVTKK